VFEEQRWLGVERRTDAIPIVIDTEGKAPTPARDRRCQVGGTLTWLERRPRSTSTRSRSTCLTLTIETVFFRHLTNYIEDPKGGKLKVVGDLATNTGEMTDGGKTWTYHLRPGVKFDDGTAITSKDIAYGLARSFGTYGEQGPQYAQNALDAKREFTPDKGDVPPGVTLPDDKTIVFSKAHPSSRTSWPCRPRPRFRRPRTEVRGRVVASGPYMRTVPTTRPRS
jgi:peptide/nickel transport system substrate-binding protein